MRVTLLVYPALLVSHIFSAILTVSHCVCLTGCSDRLGSADGGNWVGAKSSVTADDTIGYHDLDGDTRISAAEFEQNYKVGITQCVLQKGVGMHACMR